MQPLIKKMKFSRTVLQKPEREPEPAGEEPVPVSKNEKRRELGKGEKAS